MKPIEDLSPKGRHGDIAVVRIVPGVDRVLARGVFNLKYLGKLVRKMEKETRCDDGKAPVVEVQLIMSTYAELNGLGEFPAITLRACTISEQYIRGIDKHTAYTSTSPTDGYYAVAPLRDTWPLPYDLSDLPGVYV